MVREKFPQELELDLFTGVRGLHIEVRKEIPSSLIFLNRRGRIYYDGMKQKCFLCKKEGHVKVNCPQKHGGASDEENLNDQDGIHPALSASNTSRVEQASMSDSGIARRPIDTDPDPELNCLESNMQKKTSQHEKTKDSSFAEVLKGFAEQEQMEVEEFKKQNSTKRQRTPASGTTIEATDEDGFIQKVYRRTCNVKKEHNH